MTMPASASPRATATRHRRGDVGIVHRLRSVGAEIVHRQAAAAQERDERLPQRDAGVVAGDRDRPDVGAGASAGIVAGSRALRAPRVTRRSRSVSCASGVMCPPCASITVSPRVEHARVGSR